MFKLAFYRLCAFIVVTFFGSLADSQHYNLNSENQCSRSIHTALRPMDTYIKETNFQLSRIEGEQKVTQDNLQALKDGQQSHMTEVQTMMDALLLAVQIELENQSCQKTIPQDDFRAGFQAFQDKLESRLQEQTRIQHELNSNLLATQTQLIGQQKALQNSLNVIMKNNLEIAAMKSITKEELEASLKTFQKKIEGQLNSVLASSKELLDKIKGQSIEATNHKTLPTATVPKIPANFQQIGKRYFYIENTDPKTWHNAVQICRRKGGYLASIENEDELRSISKKVKPNIHYWLGIYYQSQQGLYVSIASQKQARFLKWNYEHKGNNFYCVCLFNGAMTNCDCSWLSLFICQLDNEV
ncbi:accessory gland protein Acp29AB-like [Drosophila subpulchrella]|uniref:accessory gland protein Acp29AB-like n=1 Tax=Drosophila subpulchrella TaxID=1486046 RepID=UPI0018A158C8|nr:accessory gland protein Acp29AB-like [Drosophila subpulchrella]